MAEEEVALPEEIHSVVRYAPSPTSRNTQVINQIIRYLKAREGLQEPAQSVKGPAGIRTPTGPSIAALPDWRAATADP